MQNLETLFKIENVPCDTQMRTRLDTLSPNVSRIAFQRLFTLLQRAVEKYNTYGPHRALKGLTPMEYIQKTLEVA